MLPFVAGVVVGGMAVFALGNKKELSKAAQKSYEKGKEVACDIKKTAIDTAQCIKSKLDKEEVVEAKVATTKPTTKSKKG